jgi:hypothetical protein
MEVDPLPPMPAVVTEFLDVLTGLGKLPVEYYIRLAMGDNAVHPVDSAAGRLPFSLKELVYTKLVQMVADGIIVPVTEPTGWVSLMLVVSKPDGDVRLVLDPANLNKAILRKHLGSQRSKNCLLKLARRSSLLVLTRRRDFIKFRFQRSLHTCALWRRLRMLSFYSDAVWDKVGTGSVSTNYVGVVW